MSRRTGLDTMGNPRDTGTPEGVGGHAESPATWVDAAVRVDPDLSAERASRLRCGADVRRGWCAAKSLKLQEPIGEEAHGGVVVEARPRAALEVVQAQFLFELLIALLDVPTTLPQLHRVLQRRAGRQVGQRVANRAVDPPFDEQPACFSLRVGHMVGGPPVLPAVRRPDAPPGELGV